MPGVVSNFTVSHLAEKIGVSSEEILLIFQSCNIFKRGEDSFVSVAEEEIVKAHIAARQQVSHIQDSKGGQIKRRVRFQLNSGHGTGAGTVLVEVRKKRKKAATTPGIDNPLDNPEAQIPSMDADIEKNDISEHLHDSNEHDTQVAVTAAAEHDDAGAASSAAEAGKTIEIIEQHKEVSSNINTGIDPSASTQKAAAAKEQECEDNLPNTEPAERGYEEGSGSALSGKVKTKHNTAAPADKQASNWKKKSTSLGYGGKKLSAKLASHKLPQKKLHKNISIQSLDEFETVDGSEMFGKKIRSSKAPKAQKKDAVAGLKQKFTAPVKVGQREVKVREGMTVSQFADRLSLKANLVLKEIIKLGLMSGLSEKLDTDVMELVAANLGFQLTFATSAVEDWVKVHESDTLNLAAKDVEMVTRPPIVTVMGHVDHGKTSLLDYIRKSNLTEKEKGGITQKIGAYTASYDGREIVFIDTPGHATFTAMRSRGASVTDVVVIVISIEDGVMGQTVEAIQHAKAAGAPVIIAITKIDKLSDNIDKLLAIKESLLTYQLVVEEWGGDTQVVQISTRSGVGVDDLLEAILLQADSLDLKVNYKGPYTGIVIESELEKGMGPVSTVISKTGTLKRGDIILCGTISTKVRLLKDDRGRVLDLAEPSKPIALYGLPDLAEPGEKVYSVGSDKVAKSLASERRRHIEDIEILPSRSTELEAWRRGSDDSSTPHQENISVVIKADTFGGLEALKSTIERLNEHDGFCVHIRGSGVGGISIGDVALAKATGAVLVGFNVRPDGEARLHIERGNIKLYCHSVIYALIKSLQEEVVNRLPSIKTEHIKGIANVKAIFRSQKFGLIAGSVVAEGVMAKKSLVRIVRDSKVIYLSELESLRRGKDDVQEVRAGNECGIGVRQYPDVKIGDVIESYEIEESFRDPFAESNSGSK